MVQYKIMGKQVLLGASFSEDLGTNGVNGNEALSRGGDDFWDDEE